MYTRQWLTVDTGLHTNKFPEAHNHALQLTAGCPHPGNELLVEIQTLYNTDAELHIQQALSGTVLVPHGKKKSKISPNVTIQCIVYMMRHVTSEKLISQGAHMA